MGICDVVNIDGSTPAWRPQASAAFYSDAALCSRARPLEARGTSPNNEGRRNDARVSGCVHQVWRGA
jgi:hypothetical protein